MNASSKTDPDLAALQDDIAALKGDVASLLEHLKAGASAGAQSAAEQLDEGAQRLYRDLAAGGEHSLKTIAQQVEKQPLVALLIAFGVGYLAGRLLSR